MKVLIRAKAPYSSVNTAGGRFFLLHPIKGVVLFMGMTKDDVMHAVKEAGVNFIRLQFTDLVGQLKTCHYRSSCRKP